MVPQMMPTKATWAREKMRPVPRAEWVSDGCGIGSSVAENTLCPAGAMTRLTTVRRPRYAGGMKGRPVPPKALIFDFDGLIIDSETAIADTWRELYGRHGLDFPEHLWCRMVGTREHDDLLWNDLAEQTGLTFDLAVLEPERRARGVALANGLAVLPGVVEHLDAAREAGLALAVASSSSDWWVSGHLTRLGLRDRFAHVCTRELATRSKPDSGIYLVALERLGMEAADAIAFEDSQAGVAAARAAGIRVVAVPGSFSEEMDFSADGAVLPTLAEVEPARLWEALEERR